MNNREYKKGPSMQWLVSLRTWGWLIWRDIRVLQRNLIDSVLDSVLLPISFILVSGYVLPTMGITQAYGSFMVIGWLVAMVMNTPATEAAHLVADLDSEKRISYELTLPLPYWLLYLKYATVYAIKTMITNALTLPLGIILLWNRFDLTYFSFEKWVGMYMLMAFLFSFFALFVAIKIHTLEAHSRFWLRWGWQLMGLGGMATSWLGMYQVNELAAYVNLLNPMVYPFEGIRTAVFGQAGYINYWVCIIMMLIFMFFFAYQGIRNFKRRLDCV